MSRFRKLSHTIWHCHYHIVWVPKYRFRILTGNVKEEVNRCIRAFSEQQKDAKSGSVSASAQFGFGCFSAKVSIKGSISSSKEQTRKSDNSAKYHVEVHASDDGMPEGLSRVMDILQSAAVPKSIAQTPA